MTLLVPKRSRVWKYWAAHFLGVEFGLASVVGLLFAGWVLFWGGSPFITSTEGSYWSQLFSTLATLFGALFGFAITAASIAVALVTDEKLRRFVLAARYLDLWDTFRETIVTLGLGLAVSLSGLVLAGNPASHVPVVCILIFLGTLAGLRLTRTVWLLDALPRLHADIVRNERKG